MANATRQSDIARGPFIGRYSGTTAAQNIHIGFKPALILAYNQTDGDKIWVWSKNDVANIVTVDTEVATEVVAIAQVDNGTVLGFSLPSNASVNEDAKVFVFIAYPEA